MSDLPSLPGASADADSTEMDMSTFLMSSAHDMKNSISVMTACLGSALAELPDDAASREMTYQALYEAQRLNHHLMQLMAIYKINQDMYPFDPAEVDLAEFQQEVLARVGPLAKVKGIALEVVVDPNEPSWYFDYELIVSLVAQSLHNAVKYTGDKVRLSMMVVERQLEIRIDDNGAGFPPFLLEQGFPTMQGISAHTGSTGLGLYFAAKVAHLHRNRGRVGATRLANDGALGGGTFILTLP
jgi:two-component system, OmpR family, sensor histidine kinase SenX3